METIARVWKVPNFIKVMTLMHSRGDMIRVKFNSKGWVIMINGAKYISYIKMLACTKLPIDVVVWRQVQKETKENIWQDALVYITYPQYVFKPQITIFFE